MWGSPDSLLRRYSDSSVSPSRRKTSWKRVTVHLLPLDRRGGREGSGRRASRLLTSSLRGFLGRPGEPRGVDSAERPLGWVGMAEPVKMTLYNDAGCPWGYSANPAFRVLEWRYGAQLEWRLVLIGLTNVAQEYVDRGYTPLRSAEGYARRFRRFGMPLAPNPRARIVGTGRSCRAIVAVRMQVPGQEWAAFRALQFGFFTTTLLLDEDEGIAAVLRGVDGIDVDPAIAAIDTPAVEDAYQRDRAEARSAAGSATQLQNKHSTTDGPVRTRPRRSCSSTPAAASRPVAGRRSRPTT